MSEEEKIYKFGPSSRATPERWRARFNVVYQVRQCGILARKSQPTQADLDKYAATFPEEGERLKRLHGLSRFTGLSTAAGFLGGGAWVLRTTRNVPLVVVGTFLTTFTSIVVGDDIGSWIYGTYKFDNAGTNEKLLRWVNDSRQTA